MIYESINIPLWRALRTQRGKRVLDVGCGTGALGELLQQNGNTVHGLTHSPDEANIAQGRLAKVTVLDLNGFAADDPALGGPYDILLFAGVLEHLLDPSSSLKGLLPRLAPGGKVYVSLPNIACFYVRLGLLFGSFNMSKSGGILDETHLHNYTLKTAKAFLAENGLAIETVDFMPALSVWLYQTFFKEPAALSSGQVPERMSASRAFKLYEQWIYPVEHFTMSVWRGMFANEIVFVCHQEMSADAGPK